MAHLLVVPPDYLADVAPKELPTASGLADDERAILALFRAPGLGRVEGQHLLATLGGLCHLGGDSVGGTNDRTAGDDGH